MALWRKYPNWKYEYFEADAKPEHFPGFESAVELWRSKRRGRKVPAWSDFDFYDFKGWHGNIEVTEFSYDPFDFRYRLFGTKISELFNKDLTGKYLSELANQSFDVSVDLRFYEMMGLNMYIARTGGEAYWVERDHVSVTFLELPMSDDQLRVSHSLVFVRHECNPPSAAQ